MKCGKQWTCGTRRIRCSLDKGHKELSHTFKKGNTVYAWTERKYNGKKRT